MEIYLFYLEIMEKSPIFVVPNNKRDMKSTEFHRMVRRNGWTEIRQTGSHIIYEKDGKKVTVPDHGSKEMKKGLVEAIKKQMGLK